MTTRDSKLPMPDLGITGPDGKPFLPESAADKPELFEHKLCNDLGIVRVKIETVRRQCDQVIDAIEEACASQVQRLSDRILLMNPECEKIASPARAGASRADKFEGLLRGLNEIHVDCTIYRIHIGALSALAVQGLPDKYRANPDLPELKSTQPAHFETYNQMLAALKDVAKPLHDIIHMRHAGERSSLLTLTHANTKRGALVRAIDSLLSHINIEQEELQTLELILANKTSPYPHLHTELIKRDNVDSTLLSSIFNLCEQYRRAPGDEAIKKRGVTITKQSPEILEQYLKEGALIITLRNSTGELKGFALYFAPNQFPERLNGCKQYYQNLGPHAFIHNIVVAPDVVGTPAHQMLLNAVLVQLQTSDARCAVGIVESTNEIGAASHFTNGWIREPRHIVHVKSPAGETATFVGHYLPVSPQLRALIKPPEIRASYNDSALVRGPSHANLINLSGIAHDFDLTEKAAQSQLKSSSISELQMVAHLATAKDPVVVRITGGCGNMHRRDWLGAIDLIQTGFEDFRGAIISGATRMIPRTDDGLGTGQKGSICELGLAINAINPDCRLGGISIGEHTASKFGDHIALMDTDPRSPYLTVFHCKFSEFLLVDETAQPLERSWDTEFIAALKLANKLEADHGFKSCLFCFNGGKTTEREIYEWANAGKNIILIRGSGGITDQLASDRSFLEAYPNILVVDRNTASIKEALQLIKNTQSIGSHAPRALKS